MANLSNKQKAIIKDYPLDLELFTLFRKRYQEFVDMFPLKSSFNGITS
jgi:hypothetical protein